MEVISTTYKFILLNDGNKETIEVKKIDPLPREGKEITVNKLAYTVDQCVTVTLSDKHTQKRLVLVQATAVLN